MSIWGNVWRSSLPSRLAAQESAQETRQHVEKFGDGFLLEKEIEFTAGSTEDDIFTVTGLVALRVIGVITEDVASTGDSASVGTSDTAEAIIPNTTGVNLNGEVGAIWVDAAPQTNGEIKTDAFSADMFVVHSDNIVATSTANHDAGKVKFYCYWKPLSANGNVVAA